MSDSESDEFFDADEIQTLPLSNIKNDAIVPVVSADKAPAFGQPDILKLSDFPEKVSQLELSLKKEAEIRLSLHDSEPVMAIADQLSTSKIESLSQVLHPALPPRLKQTRTNLLQIENTKIFEICQSKKTLLAEGQLSVFELQMQSKPDSLHSLKSQEVNASASSTSTWICIGELKVQLDSTVSVLQVSLSSFVMSTNRAQIYFGLVLDSKLAAQHSGSLSGIFAQRTAFKTSISNAGAANSSLAPAVATTSAEEDAVVTDAASENAYLQLVAVNSILVFTRNCI